MNGGEGRKKSIEVFEKVHVYRAPFDGLWNPMVIIQPITEGTIAGRLQSLHKAKTETIRIRESGVVVWMKSSLHAKKNDDLIAVATSKRTREF